MARYEIQQSVEANVSARLVALSGASVTVNDLRGTALTVYLAETGATTITNPLTTDANGQIEGWVEAPDFDLVVTRGSSSTAFNTYTAHVRQSPNFNVKSYGAKGDGVTDDTAAVQAAITAAAAGTLLFPPGTYLVRSTLTVLSNTTIMGSGWGSQITMDGAWAGSTLGCLAIRGVTGVTVRDIRIEGQRSTKSSSNPNVAVGIAGASDVRIERVYITDPTFQGVIVSGVASPITSDIVITGCYVFRGGDGVTGSLANGISTDATSGTVQNVTIANNHLLNNTDTGIGIHDNSNAVTVVGNTIDSPGSKCIDIAGAQQVVVTGNVCRSPGRVQAGLLGAINVSTDKTTFFPQDVVISNNILIGSSTAPGGATLYGITSRNVAGNTSDRLMIVHNIIRGFTSTGAVGILIDAETSLTTIHGNAITGCTSHGVQIDEEGGTSVTHVLVTDNMVTNNGGFGLHLTTLTTGKVQNNYLLSNTSGASNISTTQKGQLDWQGNGPQDTDHYLNGQTVISAVGTGLSVAEGSNAKMGTAVLVAGSKVVSTTAVTSSSRIYLTSNVDGGAPGFLRASARSAGTSFTITSSSGTDTSTVAWLIVEPA